MSDRRDDAGTDLNTVVSAYLASMGLLERSREGLCAFLWAEVAGDWYARHSYVTSVRDGVVNVRCDSAPRAQQLQLDSPAIIKRLNAQIGERYVTQIRASSAGIDRRPSEEIDPAPQPLSPTLAELEKIAIPPEQLQSIAERAHQVAPEFRDQLERIMIAHARVEIWRRDNGFARCPECEVYHRDSDSYCLACKPPERPTNAGGEEGLSAFFDQNPGDR